MQCSRNVAEAENHSRHVEQRSLALPSLIVCLMFTTYLYLRDKQLHVWYRIEPGLAALYDIRAGS